MVEVYMGLTGDVDDLIFNDGNWSYERAVSQTGCCDHAEIGVAFFYVLTRSDEEAGRTASGTMQVARKFPQTRDTIEKMREHQAPYQLREGMHLP